MPGVPLWLPFSMIRVNTIQDLHLFLQMCSHILNIIRSTPKLLDKANEDSIKIRHNDLLSEAILEWFFNISEFNNTVKFNFNQYNLHINDL